MRQRKSYGIKFVSRVGGTGSARDLYYEDYERTLCRLVGKFRNYPHLLDQMVEYAIEWLVRNEAELMQKYPTGSLLATVAGTNRFIDFQRWYDRRAGKDVHDAAPQNEGDDMFSFFDVVSAADASFEDQIANRLLMEDIYEGIHKHLEPNVAQAFISVEFEKKSVNETAADLGTAHYNVSKWTKKAKELLATAIIDHPEDFGLAA